MSEYNVKLGRDQFIGEIDNGKFVDFEEREINEIKEVLTKYKGYFAIVPSTNPLFFDSLFSKKEIEEGYRKYELINQVIYCQIGSTTRRKFNIAKLDDDWYLVEMEKRTFGKEGNQISEYYKCDQIEGIIDLISKETKTYKVFNKEEFDKKRERKKMNNRVFNVIRNMNSDEFNKIYNQLVK